MRDLCTTNASPAFADQGPGVEMGVEQGSILRKKAPRVRGALAWVKSVGRRRGLPVVGRRGVERCLCAMGWMQRTW